jgi:hypothetical protein
VRNFNEGIMVRDGELRRKRAAVTANDIVANAVAQQLAATPMADDAMPKNFEVEFWSRDQQRERRRAWYFPRPLPNLRLILLRNFQAYQYT